MIRNVSILLIAACLHVVATAQTVELPLTFVNTLPTGTSTYGFTVAANPNATTGVDSMLNEQEIPSLPPPAGVFIVYSVPPTPDYIWLSPRDVRPFQTEGPRYTSYDLGVTWTGGKLDVTWGQLSTEIDSAYITDVITDFPNNFIKQRIEPGASFSTTNSAITKLKVLVWYKQNVATVNEQERRETVWTVYPQPAVDQVTLGNVRVGSLVTVIDLTGRVRYTERTTSETPVIDIRLLEPGAYVISLSDAYGYQGANVLLRQ